jgi:non-ribosomal peptide synthetase component F
VQHFVRAHELTLNTVFQGVWAFQLGRRSGQDDVVFGSVVSGRQADFPGIAGMVGLFINTLPVRVQLPPEDTVVAWLRKLQMQQAEARAWEFSSLVSIQKYSAVSHGQPLFESVLIFQNLPAIDLSGGSRNVTILDVRPFERNSYPLSLVIAPGPPLTIKFVYDHRRFNDATVAGVVAQFRKVLMQVVVSPLQPLSSIRANTEAEKAQLLSSFNVSLEVR